MRFGAAVLVMLLGLAPVSAIACSIPRYEDADIVIHADRLAEGMVAAAATVDLVELSAIEPWDPVAFFADERAQVVAQARPEWVARVHADYDHYEGQYRLFGASTATFRVVERLKGVGSEGFSVGAFVVRPENEEFGLGQLTDLIPQTGPLPSSGDLYARRIVDLRDHQGTGSCAMPVVVSEGSRYLVFRDSRGGLLQNGVQATDRRNRPVPGPDGPSFEAVASDDDIWLDAVRRATMEGNESQAR